MKTNETVIQAT